MVATWPAACRPIACRKPRGEAQPLVVVLTPRVLVQVLAASLSKRPRVPARTPSHAMQPRGLVLQIAFVPTRALVLLGPF